MPHYRSLCKKNLLKRYGFFNNNFKNFLFDYDFIIRLYKNKDIRSYYLPIISVKIFFGGNSNKIKNIIFKMKEEKKIIKKNII